MYRKAKSKNVRSHIFFVPISPTKPPENSSKRTLPPQQYHSNSNGELSAVAAATAISEQVKERGRGIYTHFSHISLQYIIWEIQLTSLPPVPLPSSPSSRSPSTSSPPKKSPKKLGHPSCPNCASSITGAYAALVHTSKLFAYQCRHAVYIKPRKRKKKSKKRNELYKK